MGMDTKSSSGSNTSTVWGGQSPFLEQLYQQGADQLGQFQPQTQVPGQAMQAWGQQLQPQANPYLQDMTQVYRDQLGQANQQTGGQAGLTGGYGGGRQGVAEHLNQQAYSQNVGSFLGNQYQGDMNRAQGALGMTGQMMGMDPQQQQMNQLGQYSQILGGPTVLGEGSTKSSGFGVGLK